MSDGDSSPFEDLGAGKSPSTPGASPPPDPEHLKGLTLHLVPKLAAWKTSEKGRFVDDLEALGEYIEVWQGLREGTLEAELYSDLCIHSATATANLENRVPCWAVATSNGRASGCKVRATKGFFCGRHCGVNTLQDHLDPTEDPHRCCSSACFTCGETFSQGEPPLRCCICARAVHGRCLAKKLQGSEVNISVLDSRQVACEACYFFREADLCVYQAARVPGLLGALPETVAERAKLAVSTMFYFPLHLSLCAPFMKEALISQRKSLGYTQQGQTPHTGIIKLREYLPSTQPTEDKRSM